MRIWVQHTLRSGERASIEGHTTHYTQGGLVSRRETAMLMLEYASLSAGLQKFKPNSCQFIQLGSFQITRKGNSANN